MSKVTLGLEAPAPGAELARVNEVNKMIGLPTYEQPDQSNALMRGAARRYYDFKGAAWNAFGNSIEALDARDWNRQQAQGFGEPMSYKDINGPFDAFTYAGETIGSAVVDLAAIAAFTAGGSLAGPGGGFVGGATALTALHGTDTASGVRDAGYSPTLENVGAATSAKVAMDLAPFGMVLKRLGLNKAFNKAAAEAADETQALKRIAEIEAATGKRFDANDILSGTFGIGLTESVVELAQTYVDQTNIRFLQDQSLTERTPEEREEMINAMLGGFIGGGALGGASTVVGKWINDPTTVAQEEYDFLQARVAEIRAEQETRSDLQAAQESAIESILTKPTAANAELIEGLAVPMEPIQGQPDFAMVSEAFQDMAEEGGMFGIYTDTTESDYVAFDAGRDLENKMEAVRKEIVNMDMQLAAQMGSTSLVPTSGLGTQVEQRTTTLDNLRSTPDAGMNQGVEALAKARKLDLSARGVINLFDPAAKDIQKSVESLSGLMNAMVQKFAPGMRIILAPADALGMGGATSGVAGYTLKTDTGVIGLSNDILQKAAKDGNATYVQVLAHEFGHILSTREYGVADGQTKRVILEEYLQWLEDAKTLTFEQWVQKYEAPVTVDRFSGRSSWARIKDLPTFEAMKVGMLDYNYHLSFDEYFAQQTAKYIMENYDQFTQGVSASAPFWQKLAAKLKAMLTVFQSVPQFKVNNAIGLWLERVRKVHELKPGTMPAAKKFVNESLKSDLALYMQADPNVSFLASGINSPTGQRFVILNNDTMGVIGTLVTEIIPSIGKVTRINVTEGNVPSTVIQKFIRDEVKPQPNETVQLLVSTNSTTNYKRLLKTGFKVAVDDQRYVLYTKKYPVLAGNNYELVTVERTRIDGAPEYDINYRDMRTGNIAAALIFDTNSGNFRIISRGNKSQWDTVAKDFDWNSVLTELKRLADAKKIAASVRLDFRIAQSGLFLEKFKQLGIGQPTATDGVYTVNTFNIQLPPPKIDLGANLNMGQLENMTTMLNKMGVPNEVATDIKNYGDLAMRGWAFFKKTLTPLQIAERYNFDPAKRYIREVEEFAKTKTNIMAEADEVARVWKKLPKMKANDLAKFIYNVSINSDEAGKKFDKLQLEAWMSGKEELNGRRYNFDTDMKDIYFRMEASFAEVLQQMKTGLVTTAAKKFTKNATEFAQRYMEATTQQRKIELIEEYSDQKVLGTLEEIGAKHPLFTALSAIENQIDALKDRNYFPRSRFGKYTVKLVAKSDLSFDGKVFKKGETAAFWTYESKAEWQKAHAALIKEYGNKFEVPGGQMSEVQYSFVGMPQVLIEKMKNDPLMELSQEQRTALDEISLQLSPGKSFLRHLEKRKGIKGYSEDALRTYASYMVHAANHMARVKHSEALIAEIEGMDRIAKEPLTMNMAPVTELHDYFKRHYKYIMNPENDWAKYRALGFMWYLGFNVKSAFVNLTQVPMVTYPLLGARHGDLAALKAIGKANADVVSHLRGKKVLSEQEELALMEAMKQGITDQSFATELAGLTDGEAISQILPTAGADRVIAKMSDWGGFMFKHTEQYNRRVAFLSAFRLAMEETKDFEQAFESAKDVVQKTMFEYSKWNRPEMMRGKKSVIFMFMQHVQHMSYLMYGLGNTPEATKTAMRSWMVMFAMAGLLGLPGMEILLDLIDLGGTKFKEMTGMKNPRVDMRESIRETIIDTFDVSPDLFMKGMASQYGLGALSMGEQFGLPNVDLTGSISMGYLLPWTKDTMDPGMETDQRLGQLVKNLAGPVAAMPYGIVEAIASDNPDTWKRIEKSLPLALKNVSKAMRWQERGAETLNDGARFKEWDLTSVHDRLALVYQSMGFGPSQLMQQYEKYGAVQEARLYWNGRRQIMMETYAFAVQSKDREGIAAAKKDVNRFNHQVRNNKLLQGVAISPSDLARSVKNRKESIEKKEKMLPPERTYEPMAEHIKKLYGT